MSKVVKSLEINILSHVVVCSQGHSFIFQDIVLDSLLAKLNYYHISFSIQ